MKPWLLLPSELAHTISPIVLKLMGCFSDYKTFTWKPLEWRGQHFTNPLGIAGGFDKNADLIKSLWCLGVGFVEVGTITPLPQSKNPGVTLDRDNTQRAVWNALGFPNEGADKIFQKLKKIPQPHFTPIFVNIGKNRQTSLENAHKDYLQLLEKFSLIAENFVVNISSPNTQSLRDLLQPQSLKKFLQPLCERKNQLSKNMLLKISPDITEAELKTILDISAQLEIDGWILTNTTLERSHALKFPSHGGVSGAPLTSKSELCLRWASEFLGNNKKDKLLVSAGGIMNADDAKKRLDLGADLLQVYTAVIFEGPLFFRQIFESMQR